VPKEEMWTRWCDALRMCERPIIMAMETRELTKEKCDKIAD